MLKSPTISLPTCWRPSAISKSTIVRPAPTLLRIELPTNWRAVIATYHDDGSRRIRPQSDQGQLAVSDTPLRAFSPEKQRSWEELIAFLPRASASWLGESPDAAKAELSKRLAAVPL
jgi:hypothetical protein